MITAVLLGDKNYTSADLRNLSDEELLNLVADQYTQGFLDGRSDMKNKLIEQFDNVGRRIDNVQSQVWRIIEYTRNEL